MNHAARLLDGELTPQELTDLLQRLPADPALRDEVSTWQLLRDAQAGMQSPDDGYTLRILARVRAARQGG